MWEFIVRHFIRSMKSERGEAGSDLSDVMSWPFSGGEAAKTDAYGALNPEQKKLMQQLGGQLSSTLTAGPQPYAGELSAGITSGEEEAVARNARLTALGEEGLQSSLKGEFPEEYYQKSIYDPMLKQYNEDILPGIQEAYANPSGSGYWGSARAGAVGKGYRDLADTLASKRAELGWEAQKNIPNAISAANALSTTNAAVQGIPRVIKQYGLDKKYLANVQSNADYAKWVDQALAFMGLGSAVYHPKEEGFATQMASAIIPAVAGAAAGSIF